MMEGAEIRYIREVKRRGVTPGAFELLMAMRAIAPRLWNGSGTDTAVSVHPDAFYAELLGVDPNTIARRRKELARKGILSFKRVTVSNIPVGLEEES